MSLVEEPRLERAIRAVRAPSLEAVAGLVHGFEQRLGPQGWETRDASRLRVARALEPLGRLHLMQQVHGAVVRAAPWEGRPEGDAAVASAPGVLVAVETADCLPILLVDPHRRLAAAVHAGWRGTAAGVASRALEALTAAGAEARDVKAVLGPAIGPCCYEVGEEVNAAFGPAGGPFFRPGPRGRAHLDLRAANERQLLDSGVPAASLARIDDCTFCRADLYHSYRREGAGGGRMISFVGWSA
jgi:YfiH family protein